MAANISYQILRRTAELITGNPDVPDRPGQVALTNRIDGCLGGLGGPVVSEAPTGLGKSASYLAPAAYNASLGERTVISTESLALQTQIVDKDAPKIAEACEQITGYRPTVAVLKGFSNYVCSRMAAESAELILGETNVQANRASANANPQAHLRHLLDRLDKTDPTDIPHLPLVAWALEQSLTDGTGDKFHFDGMVSKETWDTVSVSSTECVGVDVCPFADMCLPRKSRTVAAESDIVVTNHTMLGVQAAKGVPVVLGSKTLGHFNNIVVDEAHGLPGIVRNQGAAYVSGLRVFQAASALKSVFDTHDAETQMLITMGEEIGEAIEAELQTWAENLSEGATRRLAEGENPLEGTRSRCRRWARVVLKNLDVALTHPHANEIRIRRLMARFDDLVQSLRDCTEHEPGTARWVEVETRGTQPWTVVRYTPVDVSSALKFNLWTVLDPEAGEDEQTSVPTNMESDPILDDDGEGKGSDPFGNRIDLNVVCVSATLQPSFCRDTGLRTKIEKFESPFTTAFSQSVLFVPRADSDEDVRALAGDTAMSSRPRFNTRLHVNWAGDLMCQLVEANNGAALVLAATASAGRDYVEKLEAHAGGRWQVISQWGGLSIRQATDTWKADPTSVLVGTRSLMTGVDAPGETNSLVIVDRIPRAASNPVDDARVEKLMTDADFDKWAADRLVYGGDAALLLEQAVGRLVRTASDSGMAAILDPRLLKVGRMNYPGPTRDMYMGAVSMFSSKMSNLDKACAWLRRRQAERTI